MAARRKRVRTESSEIPVSKIVKMKEDTQDCMFTELTRVWYINIIAIGTLLLLACVNHISTESYVNSACDK